MRLGLDLGAEWRNKMEEEIVKLLDRVIDEILEIKKTQKKLVELAILNSQTKPKTK